MPVTQGLRRSRATYEDRLLTENNSCIPLVPGQHGHPVFKERGGRNKERRKRVRKEGREEGRRKKRERGPVIFLKYCLNVSVWEGRLKLLLV